MILHFLTDDKFADYAIAQFSAPEMQSEFVCLNTAGRMNLVELQDEVRVMSPHSEQFATFLEGELKKYSAIILHGMHWGWWQKEILKRVPGNVKVAWVFWGGEIYGRSDLHIKRYAPITSLLNRWHLHKNKKKKARNKGWELPIELYRRVDYCLTGEKEEYEYAKAFLKNDHLQHIWYTYYDIDATVGALKDASCNGNNVIVGNSATETCNYFDVIPRLKRRLNPKQKVILPLSYGAPWITNAVSKYAKFFLGNAAMPLLDFMPRDEYNKILQSCSVMIMDQYIPQAQGNILTGLWLGMRVYMSEKSIAFKFFNRLGFKVFSFESEFKKYGLSSLSEEDIAVNRKVMMEWYSQEHVMQSAKNVVNILEGK